MANSAGDIPAGQAIHATAVAIAGEALVILGPSRAGKSRLAHELITASTLARPILLVGDDRVVLSTKGGRLFAAPHPRIGGFIERRGLGIVAVPHLASASISGVVALGSTTAVPEILQNFPCLRLVTSSEDVAKRVLDWWRGASTTLRPETALGGQLARKRLELVTKRRSCISPAGTQTALQTKA